MAKSTRKQYNLSNKIKICLTAGAVVAGSLLWITFGKGKPIPVFPYYAARVIDGDTFVTKEKQVIRIASVDAPNLGRCGDIEAKRYLEKLIMGKPLYLKVYFRDPYQRLISAVYTDDGLVNEKLVEKGVAYYFSTTAEIGEQIRVTGDKARQKGIGIYSSVCTQMTNKDQPNCQIKGNNLVEKIYFLPGCRTYDTVFVQLYKGDKWFCTESEAIKEGFRKALSCPK